MAITLSEARKTIGPTAMSHLLSHTQQHEHDIFCGWKSLANARSGAQASPAGLQAWLAAFPAWGCQGTWLCPPRPDPVGLRPIAEGTARAVVALISQLVPHHGATGCHCALAALPQAGPSPPQLWNTYGTRRARDELSISFCFTCLPSYGQKRGIKGFISAPVN